MRRKEFFDRICGKLGGIYPAQEARAITFILFESFLGVSKTDLFLDPAEELCSDTGPLESALKQLSEHRPLQYVLGETEFFGLPFKVDENVLVPRPETEELVRWIIRDSGNEPVRMLDIGTGSGAIAVSVARNCPASMVTAVDISAGALGVARENALRNGVEVDFSEMDILNAEPAGKFDVVVSNPPYVRELEKEAMRRNVLDYEPETALFVPDHDPLLFYRRIVEVSTRVLQSGGRLYFEINEEFGQETAALMRSHGFFDVEIRKDMFEKDRMVRGRWK